MGFYDNEKDCYIFDQQMQDGFWIQDDETQMMAILPKAHHSFDVLGDDSVWESVYHLIRKTEDDKLDSLINEIPGFSLVPDGLKRFNQENGFYTA